MSTGLSFTQATIIRVPVSINEYLHELLITQKGMQVHALLGNIEGAYALKVHMRDKYKE